MVNRIMPREVFQGETPEEAVQTFIDEWCKSSHMGSKDYRYDDPDIDQEPDSGADATFKLTRQEYGFGDPVYRDYTGSLYKTEIGDETVWEVRSWDSSTSGGRQTAPSPPGKTPNRLKGRRSRDRR